MGQLKNCTVNVLLVRRPETHFLCELATEWLFQKTLLAPNVKLTMDGCHCAFRARLRKQYLIPVMFGCLNSNISRQLHEIAVLSEVLSSELMPNFCIFVFPTWLLDLLITLPEIISCASRTIAISVSMREVRHFAKCFKFKVAWN